ALLGNDDERALMLPVLEGARDGLEAAVLPQLMARNEEVDRRIRCRHMLRIDSELRDTVVPLETDGGRAALHVEAFGIHFPFARDGAAVAVDHLLHDEIGDAGGLARCVTLDGPEEPEAGIGHTDEAAA